MPKVTFNGEAEEAQENEELKEVTKRAGWPIAYGCEDGMCGTCIVKVNSGATAMGEIGDKEGQTLDIMDMKDGAHRLACQCKVGGDLDLDQP
ncbi:(2Fe-2S)-binding protein [Candidatus Gracilibacteria bacterium]|nr:(2Fe-2S)-binding protein [Candidatus Gracilibacteria bacterium]